MARDIVDRLEDETRRLHARIAYSLDLLIELRRPVYDLHGEHLCDGWQPAERKYRLTRRCCLTRLN